MKLKSVAILLSLIAANGVIWLLALAIFRGYPVLLGTAALAYGFGLRHAVDADHIAAIDNVTRRLMAAGQKPVAAGLYFSLGHATVVVLASAAIAGAASHWPARLSFLTEIGSAAGTGISALFLFAIAGANLIVLRGVWRAFRRARAGSAPEAEALDALLSERGLYGRVFRPLFRLVRNSAGMYPIGFLFGLGFDTATEIGVLGLSAAAAVKGLSLWAILIFPALFAAGMSLVDTLDSVLMVGAYGWAFEQPLRKLTYNLAVTFASVIAAILVGGLELAGLVAEHLKLPATSPLVGALDSVLGRLGIIIIALFALSWLASAAFYSRGASSPSSSSSS